METVQSITRSNILTFEKIGNILKNNGFDPDLELQFESGSGGLAPFNFHYWYELTAPAKCNSTLEFYIDGNSTACADDMRIPKPQRINKDRSMTFRVTY